MINKHLYIQYKFSHSKPHTSKYNLITNQFHNIYSTHDLHDKEPPYDSNVYYISFKLSYKYKWIIVA